MKNCRLSRGAPSTTRPPLRAPLSKDFRPFGKREHCGLTPIETERRRNLRGEVGDFWGTARVKRPRYVLLSTEIARCGQFAPLPARFAGGHPSPVT